MNKLIDEWENSINFKAINEIESYLESGFERDLFSASILYLANESDPLRLNSFCYSLRELLRNVFDRLSPVENIKKCGWFKKETDNGLPSRRQKYIYCIQGGLASDFVENELGIHVLESWEEIKKSIDTLSKYTHVNGDTFNIENDKVTNIAREALESLLIIIQITNDTREELHSSLLSHINKELLETFFMNSISEIESLSQNSYVDSFDIENYSLSNVDHKELTFKGDGTVYVSLNYGKHDDACEINTNFPFDFQGHSLVDKPYEILIAIEDVNIDTSNW